VYDCDPEKNESAVKFDFTFEDVLKKGLNVMDTTVYIEPRKQITDRSF
jgi:uridylate kinase